MTPQVEFLVSGFAAADRHPSDAAQAEVGDRVVKRGHPEELLQRAQVDLLRKFVPPPPVGPAWNATNPVSVKSKAAAGISKALGLCPGWPDLEFLWRSQAIYVENKSPTGYPSMVQREVHAWLVAQGGIVYPRVRSLDEFIGILVHHEIPHRIDLRFYSPTLPKAA